MKTLDTLLQANERNPAATARAVRSAGGRVVGFIGADIPVELILAADAFPLLLPAGTSGQTARADVYVEASFSPLEREVAQQWLSGEFEFLDAVVFSRASDSSQRLYYYLCELQRQKLCGGPVPLLYDLPKIPRSTSAHYAEDSTRQLAETLGSQPGRLLESIELRNRRRQLLSQLQILRHSAPAPSGVLVERIDRASDRSHAHEFDAALVQWLKRARPQRIGPRLVLAGSAPPDERLHAAIEQGGGTVVAESGPHALERLGPDVAVNGDPIKALSQHYHTLQYGPRTFEDRGAILLGRVQASRADGVILWLLEEEEALVWELPRQERQLQDHAIPTLTLTRAHWDIGADVLNRVRSFTATLETRI
jgi:benzoyl-CoA reductase/2-hydroxyglutaryl-CoA dehydratase subunit BcrC/BadD/HgdB